MMTITPSTNQMQGSGHARFGFSSVRRSHQIWPSIRVWPDTGHVSCAEDSLERLPSTHLFKTYDLSIQALYPIISRLIDSLIYVRLLFEVL